MIEGACDETSISTDPTKRNTTRKEERREDKRRREPTVEWITKKSKRKMREREREREREMRARTCIFLIFIHYTSGNQFFLIKVLIFIFLRASTALELKI